jgi:lipoate-protein ligase A
MKPATGEFRLIIDGPNAGAWNMAVDEALLLDAVDNGVGSVRFYGWSEATLSLGYFQGYQQRNEHEASRGCACVRRQTGGGAILHDVHEITYSIVVPAGHRLARESRELYTKVHDAFISVLRSSLGAMQDRMVVRRVGEVSSVERAEEPFLCFERRAPGDVVVAPGLAPGRVHESAPRAGRDWKVLGSAQRRSRGALLQHGSLILRRSAAAPQVPGFLDVTGVTGDQPMVADLGVRLQRSLDLNLVRPDFPRHLEEKAQDLQNSKYGAAAWTKRR